MSYRMVRSALRAMALWTALEFALRDGGVFVLGWLFLPRPITVFPWHDVVRFSVSMQVVAMIVLGGLFIRKAARDRLSWHEAGYALSRSTVATGVLGGAALLALTNGTALLDYELFRDPLLVQFAVAVHGSGYAAQCALVLGNGILAPIVEELAWRGYIQTRLAHIWRPDVAPGVTALGFTLKHIVVDLSMARITTITVAALSLSLIRARFGTSSSTIAHLFMNLPSTVLLIFQHPTES
jgi:membrane protease YdiL (CAAX protease family)